MNCLTPVWDSSLILIDVSVCLVFISRRRRKWGPARMELAGTQLAGPRAPVRLSAVFAASLASEPI